MLLFIDSPVGHKESKAKRHCSNQNMSQPHGQVDHFICWKKFCTKDHKHLKVNFIVTLTAQVRKDKAVPVHTMTASEGVDVYLNAFLPSAWEGGQWSALCLCYFTPGLH